MLRESHGPSRTLDLPGFGLVSVGLFALVFGLVRGQSEGWTNPLIVSSLAIGTVLLAAFVAWELRAKEPMVPMGLFRKRTFAVTNAVSFFMYFGTFGSIFLLTQVLQYVLHYTPFQAGLRMLLWTGATMVVAPIAGVLSERIGSRGFMAAGLALQAGALAWFAATTSASVTFGRQAIAFVAAGAGIGLVSLPPPAAAERRQPGPGGPGAGYEQRDPRGQRRLRRGRAGHRVQRAWAPSPRRRPSSTASSRRCGSPQQSSPSARSSPWRCPAACAESSEAESEFSTPAVAW